MVGDPVIVRGFEDEPAKLTLASVRNGVIDAYGTDPARPMPFHAYRAYQFDEKLYAKLRTAFESGQTDRLSELWSQAALLFAG